MKKKRLLVLLFAFFIILCLKHEDASASVSNCQGQLKTKLGATLLDIKSVNRMCGNIDGRGFLGVMWFDKNSSNSYAGKEATDTTKLDLKNEYQDVTAHGFVLYDSGSTVNHSQTYATRISLRTCTDMREETIDGYTQFKCYGTETTISNGISSSGTLFNSTMTVKPVPTTGTTLANGWADCTRNSPGCSVNGYMKRGERASATDTWSYGGYKTFQMNTQTIKDQYFPGKTGDLEIYVYRCMSVMYMGEMTNGYQLAVGECGYDPSTIVISQSTPDPITSTSEVSGKKNGDAYYSSWSTSGYTDSDGSDSDQTTWDIKFQHKVTLGSIEYNLQTSGCPSGYTCTYNSYGSNPAHTATSHSENVTLSYAENAKVCEGVTVTDSSDATRSSSSSVCATISKSDVEKYGSDTETLYPTITFEGGCSSNPDGTSIIEIDKDISQKTITFSQTGPSSSSTSGDPNAVALIPADVGDDDFNDTHEEILNLSRGEDKTITYTGFEEKVTHTYKVTKTTPYSYYASDPSVKYYGSPTYVLDSSYHDRTTSGQATCPNVTVYRITELNTENVNIQLNTTSYWNETTRKQQNVPKNLGPVYSNNTDNLIPIYANSDKDDKISLDYTYGIQIKWLDGTVNERTKSKNSIKWYAFKGDRTTQLQEYTLEVDNSSIAKTEDLPDQDVENSDNADPNGANKGDDGNITLGTNDQQVCRAATAYGSYIAHYDKDPDPSGDKSGPPYAIICAHLYRPWNYKLVFDNVSNNSTNGLMLVDEGTTEITVTLRNDSNSNPSDPNDPQEGNPSYSPDDTTISLYRIIATKKDNSDGYHDHSLQSLNETIYSCNTSSSVSDNCITDGIEITTIAKDIAGNDRGVREATIGYKGSSNNENTVVFTDNYAYDNPDMIGKHVCYYAKVNYSDSVRDTDGASYGGKHGYGNLTKHPLFSYLTCFTVVGVPHAEVWGGSVYSEGGINTKIYEQYGTFIGGVHSGSGNYTIGSWSDYGVVGKSNIKGFASGKTIFGRYYPDNYDCQNHPLTINNKDCSGFGESVQNIGKNSIITTKTKTKLLGRYRKDSDDVPETTSVSAKTGISPDTDYPYTCYKNYTYQDTADCDDTGHLFRYTKKKSDITLENPLDDKYKLDSGATHVIYAAKDNTGNGGNITIKSNLLYGASPYSTINQIPQYIIIADGKIDIDQDVERIDAWLIAGGEINTCDDAIDLHDGSHDKNTCNKQLEINGPIFANKINLDRTTYRLASASSLSGKTMDFAAEKMDLSAFSYYWAYSQSKQTGTINTVYLRSLPPRH